MIVIKYPTRERPIQFLKILRYYLNTAVDPTQIKWIIAIDTNDPSMTKPILDEAYDIIGPFELIKQNHKSKIEAINSRVNESKYDWDILINIADDMIPVVKGWDIEIRNTMKAHFPGLDGCLWFYDNYQKNMCTMAIMGREAYNDRKYIYHPSYISLFPDKEFTEYWLKLGKLYKSMKVLFEHHHPVTGKGKWDALYARNESKAIWNTDEKNYFKRRGEGFPV